jgi:hypothetical protein
MGMIVLAIVCGVLANELFAWGPRLSDLLMKIAVDRMSPKLQERMREEWQAHLDALPGGLSKLSAAAGFLLSTFWGFRRYRQDETPIEIEERIALEVAIALDQERDRVRRALEEVQRGIEAQTLALRRGREQPQTLRRADENRTRLIKRRDPAWKPTRSRSPAPSSGYKRTRLKGTPYRLKKYFETV